MNPQSPFYRQPEPNLVGGQLRLPGFVVCDEKRGHFIVSDWGETCLKWFDCLTLKSLTSFEKTNTTQLGDFKLPSGLCLQPSTNHLLVCDTGNNRIQVLSLDDDDKKSPFPLFAVGRKPVIDANGWAEGSKKKGEFDYPEDICCSPNGDMIITDLGNDRIQIFDATGRFLSMIDNFEYSSPCNVCLVHRHFSPSSLGSGLLCVADSIQNVSVWSFGSSLSSPPQHLFNFPVSGTIRGLCVDLNGYVHVSCGDPSHVVEIYDLRMVMKKKQILGKNGTKGKEISVGGKGSGPGEFNLPTGICVDNQNALTVVDHFNMRLQVFQEEKKK